VAVLAVRLAGIERANTIAAESVDAGRDRLKMPWINTRSVSAEMIEC
jgi:hypothetical protein